MLSQTIRNAIIDHAEQGNQIAVITRNARQIINKITNEVHGDVITRISLTNGQERIEFINGAQITFHLGSSCLRGYTAHLLVIPIYSKEDPLLTVTPAANDGIEIIGYM